VKKDFKAILVLCIILLIGLVLRTWGIGFGLPFAYHFDERFYINAAGKIGEGVLSYPPYAPTGLSNIIFICFGIFFVIGKVTGYFESAQAFRDLFFTDPTFFYLIARFINVILGTFSIFLVFWLGKIISNRRVGFLAGILLATNLLHIRDSHFAVPDIAMSALVIFAVLCSVIYSKSGNRKIFFIGSFIAGLAIAFKWTALPVFFPILIASFSRVFQSHISKIIYSELVKSLILTLTFVVLGFLIGSPQIFLNPKPYIDSAFGQYQLSEKGSFGIWQVDTVSGWVFYGKVLSYGMGLTLLIFGIAGLVYQVIKVLRDRQRDRLIVLSFPVIYYLLMGSTPHYFLRYILPFLPFITIFIGDLINDISEKVFPNQVQWQTISVFLLSSIVIIPQIVSSVALDYLFTKEDTRTNAKYWIENNLPDGTKIAMDYEVHTPPISSLDHTEPKSLRVYQVSMMNETGLSDHPIEWYREQNIQYLIASSFIYEIPLVFSQENKDRKNFYNVLDQEFELVMTFTPSEKTTEMEIPFVFDEIYAPIVSLWDRDRPGPVLKIYRVK
jgi:hypothetical protein